MINIKALNDPYKDGMARLLNTRPIEQSQRFMIRQVYKLAQSELFPLYNYRFQGITKITENKYLMTFINESDNNISRVNNETNSHIAYEVNFVYSFYTRKVYPFNRYVGKIVKTCELAIIPAVFDKNNTII